MTVEQSHFEQFTPTLSIMYFNYYVFFFLKDLFHLNNTYQTSDNKNQKQKLVPLDDNRHEK